MRQWLAACALALAGMLPLQSLAQVCAAPGVSGALTVTGTNTVLNAYYPGVGASLAAATSIGYDSSLGRGAGTLAAGDMVLIIQMQDGTGATLAQDATYNFPAARAGDYEIARVVSVGANVLNLSAGLINPYTQNLANNLTYQVVRVPQYSTLTINGGASVVPVPWDGTTGGVVMADVSGAFTNNGSIDASYAGFRGNAGQSLGGVAGAAANTTANFTRYQPDGYAAHGGKGEGTAGTPDRVANVFASPGTLLALANGAATNSTAAASSIAGNAAYLANTARSYNGGSRGAGGPGNAGGGGTDALPSGNSQNTGGGGGGNTGAGGIGGNSWATNQATGGRGGAGAALANKLRLGGGGGSGTTNNGYALDTSGGAGGGLILIKAGTAGGTGSLLANGQAGRSVPVLGANCPTGGSSNCDSGGGGGAGGGIVVLASSGTVAAAQVRGGQGGNVNGIQHGPGGGGGGGYVLVSNVTAATALTGGVAGLTNAGGATQVYGAAAGGDGETQTIATALIPSSAGRLPVACLPALTTTKVTSTPAVTSPVSPPGTTTYSIAVANAAGRGDARGIVLYDPSLPGGSATVAVPPTPTATFSVAPAACVLSARTSTADPAGGSTSTFTAGTFSLPGGCSLTYTFAVNVPETLPNGTYNNSAVAWFADPSDSSGTRTVTAALPPAAAGLAANTAFTTGGAAGGANYNGNAAGNTADDIRVQRVAELQVSKTDGVTGVAAGAQTAYTLTVANLGPADGSGTILRDVPAAGLVCTAVSCAGVTGSAACPAAGTVTMANLVSPPGPGIVLTSLPANSSITFLVSCGVSATGQ